MNKKELDKIWKNAIRPDSESLDGEYRVDIVSGLGFLPSKFVKSWTKTIATPSKREGSIGQMTRGFNTINGDKMGEFTVYQYFKEECVELFYNQPGNSELWRGLKDHVRQTDDNTLIGKIYFKIWNGLGPIKWWSGYRFQGYFTLTKIMEWGRR